MKTKGEKPDSFKGFTHIDFCYRSSEHLAPKSNHPQGYWYITEIYTSNTAQVWRKRLSGNWLRIGTSQEPMEETAFELGNLKKNIDGTVEAAGSLHKNLETKLMEHMKKENKTTYPYNYWLKNGPE